MKMYLISDNVDTLTGMRLAGVEGEIAHGRKEAKAAVEKVLEDRTLGILLITEKLSFEIPELIDEIKLNRRQPCLWKFLTGMAPEDRKTSSPHISMKPLELNFRKDIMQ